MASILKVNTIQDATNSNTAMTISTGGVISEPNRPCFHVGKTADQTLSDGTVSTITFESITDGGDSGRVINKGGLFASNKFTVTSTTTGIYYFYTNLFGQSSGDATDTFVFFRKNGSTQMMSSYSNYYAGSYAFMFQLNGLINLDTAGDYVEVRVDCDQAGGNSININYNAGFNRTEFGGYKVA
jgi:hypothetical protein